MDAVSMLLLSICVIDFVGGLAVVVMLLKG